MSAIPAAPVQTTRHRRGFATLDGGDIDLPLSGDASRRQTCDPPGALDGDPRIGDAVFHLLSFEGPDPYAQAGGIGTRVTGLARALADLGLETHLWFVGDPALPGHERVGALHLHRWCQWMSRHHRRGVYHGEAAKASDYARSLPPVLLRAIRRDAAAGRASVVLAEEWHTVGAVLHLAELLRPLRPAPPVSVLWNANNTFGFGGIDWQRLARACVITTVSRYMKHLMQPLGVGAAVIPNGLPPEAFGEIDAACAARLRELLAGRTVLTKVARWDPDKRWITALAIVASLRRRGARPILIARGGMERHGAEVLAAARGLGLRVMDIEIDERGTENLVDSFDRVERADLLNICSNLDWRSRRLLYRESDAVLANSGHEPFGLVGLETMAVGGVACTGSSGEEYAVPGHNAIVLETARPEEFLALFGRLCNEPQKAAAIRAAGKRTARHYAWPAVIGRALLPRVQMGLGEVMQRLQ